MSTDTFQTGSVSTPGLPSRVEETLVCPQFRILVVGNSGVGKSSLVSDMFNISLNDIDIAHDRAGRADITHGYTSDDNPRFILHDSQGFEAGSKDNWDRAEKFLQDTSAKGRPVENRVHAIWLSVEAPREGARLQQIGDEKLLSLAHKLNIPVVIVFTKYDILVNEQYLDDTELSDAEAARKAEASFNHRIKALKAKDKAAIVKVSTNKDYPERLDTLEKLTDVTLKCLGHASNVIGTNSSNEIGNQNAEQQKVDGVSVLWTTAQQISATQKVETSISEGFKKYWRDLGKSTFFQGHTMTQCIFRIHDDILRVWNFRDPEKLLSGEDFFTQMIELVSPILQGHEDEVQQDNSAEKLWGALAAAAPAVMASPHMLIAVGIAGIGIIAFKFLYGQYHKLPLAATYLGAYIVDLTCVLHRLFVKTILADPPTPLSKELISSAVKTYKDKDLWRVHKYVSTMNFMHDYKGKITDLIYTTISLPQPSHVPQDEHIAPSLPSGSVSNPNISKSSKDEKRRRGKRQDKGDCIIA